MILFTLGFLMILILVWHGDDYIGCNVALNSYYVYNGKKIDGTGQPWAYGANPPALSVTFLNTDMNYFMYFS